MVDFMGVRGVKVAKDVHHYRFRLGWFLASGTEEKRTDYGDRQPARVHGAIILEWGRSGISLWAVREVREASGFTTEDTESTEKSKL
jgi:hypothetical protein